MNKVKVGIIGIGALGEGMVDVFSKHPLTELVALCDIDEQKVYKAAQHYQVEAYTNHKTFLDKSNIDMVYIATPPKWHHDLAIDVIRAGKHILCEKPLANSIEEAANMLQLAKEYKVVHAMNFPINYVNNTRKFGELIDSGYVGNLRRIELIMKFPTWPRKWQQNNWINTREQGGFVFEVTGHFIQLIQRFFGPLHDIKSEVELPNDPTLPETGIMASMKLANGTPVIVNGISGMAGEEEQHLSLTVYGTEGTIAHVDIMKVMAGKVGEVYKELEVSPNHFWNELITAFVDAINGDSSELYDFQVGYDVQVVLEALRNPV
ncbi:Gfo/Idh/MocA family protein [Bacillus sp. AK128]